MMPIEAWPSRSETTLGWTPPLSNRVACAWAHRRGSAVAGRRTLRVGRLEEPHELAEGVARPVADRPAVSEAGCLELEGRESFQAAPALVQDLHLRTLHAWRHSRVGGTRADELKANRMAQRGMDDAVMLSHRARRESRVELLRVVSLKVQAAQLVELVIAQCRYHVPLDHVAVRLVRTGAEVMASVIGVPAAQELGHAEIGGLDVRAGLELVEALAEHLLGVALGTAHALVLPAALAVRITTELDDQLPHIAAGTDLALGRPGDGALAETIIGLYKTELIRRPGPWKGSDDVECATLKWLDWFSIAACWSRSATSRRPSTRPPTGRLRPVKTLID